MGLKRIFRAPHLLLFLSVLLTAALAFAPISYSSNFRTNTYAEIYGSWVWVENLTDSAHPVVETIWFFQDPMLALYMVLTLVHTGSIFYGLFFVYSDAKRIKWLQRIRILEWAHLAVAVFLFWYASYFVGEASGEYIESGFQREISLHAFILLFTFSARRRYRKAVDATQAAAT